MDYVIFQLKKFAEWFVEWFVFITTGTLIICAINFALFLEEGDLPKATLAQILLSSLLTAVVTAVFFMIEPLKKSGMILCFFLHFASITGIMIFFGLRFNWIELETFGVVEMTVSVAGVYGFVMTVYYILDKHRAEQMNRRLKEKYKDEEE